MSKLIEQCLSAVICVCQCYSTLLIIVDIVYIVKTIDSSKKVITINLKKKTKKKVINLIISKIDLKKKQKKN